MNIKQLNSQILQKGYKLLYDKIKKYIEKRLNRKIIMNSDINGVFIYLNNIEFDKLDNDKLKIFELKKRTDNSYYIVLIKSNDISGYNKLIHQINKLIYKSNNTENEKNQKKDNNQSSSNS